MSQNNKIFKNVPEQQKMFYEIKEIGCTQIVYQSGERDCTNEGYTNERDTSGYNKEVICKVIAGNMIRGEENKSGLSRLNSSYSANSRPIYMYYIPNQWKFNEDFAELCRFEIAALIEA